MGRRETRAKKVRCTLLPSFVFCKRNLTCRFLFAMISGLRDLCARKFPIPFHAKADGESARRIIFSSVLSRRQSFPTSFSLLLSRSRCASAWCPPLLRRWSWSWHAASEYYQTTHTVPMESASSNHLYFSVFFLVLCRTGGGRQGSTTAHADCNFFTRAVQRGPAKRRREPCRTRGQRKSNICWSMTT